MEKMNIRLQRQVNLLIKRYPILESVEQNIIDAYLVMQESYENGENSLLPEMVVRRQIRSILWVS